MVKHIGKLSLLGICLLYGPNARPALPQREEVSLRSRVGGRQDTSPHASALSTARKTSVYTIVEIPMPTGLNSVVVHGINARGAIVGTANLRAGRSGIWAFLYRPGAASSVALDSAYHSEAWAINDRNEVGGCFSSSDGDMTAAVWYPTRTADAFRRVAPGKGIVRALDMKGNVAVTVPDGPNYLWMQNATGGAGKTQTIVRRPVKQFENDPFPGPPEAPIFDLIGRNHVGVIIGTFVQPGQSDGPPIRALVLQNGTMRLLGDDAHTHTYVNAINDAGKIVGKWTYRYKPDPDGGFVGTYFYHAVLFDQKGPHDLGALPGDENSEALAINNAGIIVGSSGVRIEIGAERKAFVLRDGIMSDLNAAIPPGSGWKLVEAQAINDRGQIAGVGTKDGRLAVFLLTP